MINYKLIENDGEHENTLLETQDLDEARALYQKTCKACKEGTYDFYCAFDELEDGLTIVLESDDGETVAEETFY